MFAVCSPKPEQILVANGEGGEKHGLIVVDFDVDGNWVRHEVSESIRHLVEEKPDTG